MSLIENEDGWIVAFQSHNYKLMLRHGWSSLIANYSCDSLSKTINIYLTEYYAIVINTVQWLKTRISFEDTLSLTN